LRSAVMGIGLGSRLRGVDLPQLPGEGVSGSGVRRRDYRQNAEKRRLGRGTFQRAHASGP
jgi:hypothetical protein